MQGKNRAFAQKLFDKHSLPRILFAAPSLITYR